MIIAICGNGYCGSSAVTDYLRDCNEVSIQPFDIEFMFLYDVDGIDDLRHHIVDRPVRFYSSDAAIKRYLRYVKNICSSKSMLRKYSGDSVILLTEKYINKIVQLSWNGWWHFDQLNATWFQKNYNFRFLGRINDLKKKRGEKGIKLLKNSKMYLSIAPKDFDSLTKEYVSSLISLFDNKKTNKIVLDQPFPMGTFSYYKMYFSDEVKTINVIRDPRDLYLMAKIVSDSYSSWIPTDNVDDFITYFKMLYSNIPTNTDSSITIRFEDLIYNCDNTIKSINSFLGIAGAKSLSTFNPQKSINNTQLFLKYPSYMDDIKRIETELRKYLYPFEKENTKPIFDGRSF